MMMSGSSSQNAVLFPVKPIRIRPVSYTHLNELKSIYGTFPKMIMSRGTFIKNIIGSSEFGDKFKMQLTGNEMYMSTGLITSQLASTIFTGIGLPAIEIKEDYVVDQTGKNIPCLLYTSRCV